MTEPNQPPRRKLRVGALAAALTATLALLCCTGGTGAFFLTELGGELFVEMEGVRRSVLRVWVPDLRAAGGEHRPS